MALARRRVYHSLAQRGYAVCAADVRGMGDLTPEIGRGAADYARSHADEENYAWASLILGKPLVGQRVTDILALVAALRAHPALSGLTLKVAASGKVDGRRRCSPRRWIRPSANCIWRAGWFLIGAL